jgi:hypothetical protein
MINVKVYEDETDKDAIARHLEVDEEKVMIEEKDGESWVVILDNEEKGECPFTDWETYFEAMADVLASGDDFNSFKDKYPAYIKQLTTTCYPDLTNVKTILHDNLPDDRQLYEWAQEGLDGLIAVLIKGGVEEPERVIDGLKEAFEDLLLSGAVYHPEKVVMGSIFQGKQHYGIRDYRKDAKSFDTRAGILMIFEKIGYDLPPEIKNAKPVYWKDENITKEMDEYMPHIYNGIKQHINFYKDSMRVAPYSGLW